MKILITGISGTLGTIVTKLLLEQGHEVVGYSRDEQKQSKISAHPNLTLYLGDVRDRDRLIEATRGVEVLFHFAALKMVDALEANPEESVHTNIIGTQNVLHAQRANDIRRVVFTSTDKAAYPVNVYGASKLVAERLVLRNPNNIVCRYGNVLGSRGSVLPEFARTLREESRVYVTDMRMTRFWIRMEDAARFVVDTGLSGSGGLHIPAMKAAKVSRLAQAVAMEMGRDACDVTVVGSRPGEKIHECLKTQFEGATDFTSDVAEQYGQDELRQLIRPTIQELSR